MVSLGTLTIELIEAKFTRSTDLVKKMDPYVAFESRDKEFEWKSSTCEKGHKKPKWEGQQFEIDVKYLGDDLNFVAKDNDPGKDEMIGMGTSKLSAFACYEDWDEWFNIEFKNKNAGKIHLRCHWAPKVQEEHSSQDEMGQIQEAIKELAAKKRDLTEQYNQIKEEMERHEEEGRARLEAENAEEGDPEKWDKKIQRAQERCERDKNRIKEQREALDEKAEEYEKKVEYEDEKAIARGEEFKERMIKRAEMAEIAKEEALKAADEARDACIEQNM